MIANYQNGGEAAAALRDGLGSLASIGASIACKLFTVSDAQSSSGGTVNGDCGVDAPIYTPIFEDPNGPYTGPPPFTYPELPHPPISFPFDDKEIGPPPSSPGDDPECEKEWEEAYETCRKIMYDPDARNRSGGYTNIHDCARGLVSFRCGGQSPWQ